MEAWKKRLQNDPLPWLLECEEPWTRYRTQTDLIGELSSVPGSGEIINDILRHTKIKQLIKEASDWLPVAASRNSDPKISYYKLRVLADFGLSHENQEIFKIIEKAIKHRENSFFAVRGVPPERTKKGEKYEKPDSKSDVWHISPCTSPIITYSLLSLGFKSTEIDRSVAELSELWRSEQGWFCHYFFVNSQFKKLNVGCPMAGLMALEVFSQIPDLKESQHSQNAFAPLEFHWRFKKTMYYFGRSKKFWTLKYPFVWYNALYLAEVLTRFDFLKKHEMIQEIIDWIESLQDENGRFKPTSIYMPYKLWTFGNKKEPSPWITLLCCRILKRWYGN